MANFMLLLPGYYLRSKHCKFSLNKKEPLFLTFLLPLVPTSLCYSSAGCGWKEFDYFRIVTGGWVQESLVG